MAFNINLQDLSNLIILIGAVLIAVKNIYTFFKKPVDDLRDRAHDNEEKHIEQVLEEKMPQLLKDNCKTILGSIEELKDMSIEQDGQLTEISNSINLLNQSQLDILRYNMNKIYYRYHPYKKILSADKKAFCKLYKDYKSMDGNTWIDALYGELKDWPIVESEVELKN